MDVFIEIVLLLISSVLIVGLFGRMRLPPILAYLYVGLLIGPFGLGLIQDSGSVRFLAEFGVVFLLFTIGLEFSLPQLVSMRWIVFGLGGAQVLIATALVTLIAWLAGVSISGAIVIGGALAMSSTALVIKQLDDQGEINAKHGRTAVGVLIFQDLAVVPFLILIPIFADADSGSMIEPLITAFIKCAAVFVIMLIAGRFIIRPLFHEIALTRSTELFTLTVLLVIIVAAWATHFAELSLALGAFLAGMMLGETEYKHQIESDIRPFQDVLLGLFFITIGMLLDLTVIKDLWFWIIPISFGIIIGKTLLVVSIMLLMSAGKRDALRSGLILAQGGEFGFPLITLALSSNLIETNIGQIILASVFVTMIVSPFLIRFNGTIVGWLAEAGLWGESRSRSRNKSGSSSDDIAINESDHAIIIGFGRFGQNITRFFDMEGIKYIAIDLDPEVVRQARMAGNSVIFGDASRFEILESASINTARLAVITLENHPQTLKIMRQIKTLRHDIPICVLTEDDGQIDKLFREGADNVVPETFESSIMLASHCLPYFDVPMSRIIRYTREFRKSGYKLLRGFFHGQHSVTLDSPARNRDQLMTVNLGNNAFSIGKQLMEVKLNEIDVTVTSIRRRNIRVPDPTADVVLLENDILILYGAPRDLAKAESILLSGK